jgi:hypothetical protein
MHAMPDLRLIRQILQVRLLVLFTDDIAFFYELDRNLESVDDFFSKKSAEMQRRLKLLLDKYGDNNCDQLDYHDLEDLVSPSVCC